MSQYGNYRAEFDSALLRRPKTKNLVKRLKSANASKLQRLYQIIESYGNSNLVTADHLQTFIPQPDGTYKIS